MMTDKPPVPVAQPWHLLAYHTISHCYGNRQVQILRGEGGPGRPKTQGSWRFTGSLKTICWRILTQWRVGLFREKGLRLIRRGPFTWRRTICSPLLMKTFISSRSASQRHPERCLTTERPTAQWSRYVKPIMAPLSQVADCRCQLQEHTGQKWGFGAF